MAVRRVLQIEKPEDYSILKSKSKRITTFDAALKNLVEDMIETMRETDGVGLAAPQIGLLRRVIVIEVPAVYEAAEDEEGPRTLIEPEQIYVMVNPEIIKASPEECIWREGCLSLPGRFGSVPRPSWVTVKYQDLNGKEQRVRRADASAITLGRIVQHEIDHLDGILFTERIVDMSTLVDYRDPATPRKRRPPLLRRAAPAPSEEIEIRN